jgi:hypothetical protein
MVFMIQVSAYEIIPVEDDAPEFAKIIPNHKS